MAGGNYIIGTVSGNFQIVDQSEAYKVTYITNGHGPENKVVYVAKNSKMTLPADMTAEAVEVFLIGVYVERRSFLIMERAKPDIVSAGLFQSNVFTYDVSKRICCLYSFHESGGKAIGNPFS